MNLLLKINIFPLQIKGLIKPEVATEIVIQLGVNVPHFSRNAIRLNGNIYFKSGFEAEISMSSNQIKFNIPAPKEPVKLLSFRLVQNYFFRFVKFMETQ